MSTEDPAGPAPAPRAGPDASRDRGEPGGRPERSRRRERRQVLLRLDPAVHDALARWAADELRSVNAQVDLLVRRALREAGRLPDDVAPPRGPGRPRRAGADGS